MADNKIKEHMITAVYTEDLEHIRHLAVRAMRPRVEYMDTPGANAAAATASTMRDLQRIITQVDRIKTRLG